MPALSLTRVRVRQVAAAVAATFGIVSIGAGASVLAGRDPGYLAFRPLVIFNTVMGFLYIGAAVLIWRRARLDRVAASFLLLTNLFVLLYVWNLHRTGGLAAVDSVRAMILRTGLWLAILLALVWLTRTGRTPAEPSEGGLPR